ncbi:paladin [Octopus bimaculoides]|uniref:Tyrosine specific protein phosphatases domain-containing protein n=1 Tax=Octopus bimaculoides TaxID=37653 RepID=A0A0L8HJM2_OCTBM|nr:paladin [Octopus bimaculoides]XP_014771799.1 paladin [Octopus bimaculoides]XP_014771800.1 paladin [Octopus bimaculoides]XP_014771801.1 paladin [Octopus bimaculoides]XP_014771802.1 paladin [Octopus bimaculoides]|eukprot:XP_014771798.1 PREDICTED: paladin-like [Octopus bimaculoides]
MGLICGSQSQNYDNAKCKDLSDNKPHFKRNNIVISFKNNVTEEYQNFNIIESLKFGKLCEHSKEHILIDNKYFLVSDRPVDFEGKPLKESAIFSSYWKANHLPLYGMAQPNTANLKKILEMLLAHSKPVLLLNLREEPVFVLAVNQHAENAVSYSIRTKEEVHDCIVTGLTEKEANEHELTLRKQVLRYAATSDSFDFPFYNCPDEEPYIYNVQYEDFLITSNEMYSRLQFEYAGLRYFRWCMPLYSALSEEQFDSFISFMKPYVFDVKQTCIIPAILIAKDKRDERCTTAMVMCSLLYGNVFGFPHEANSSPAKINPKKPCYEKGEFQVIRSLVSLVPDGLLRKQQVDVIIDMCCAEGQNLRLCILQAKNLVSKLLENHQIKESQEATNKALRYLDRYFYLICFNAYLAEQARQAFNINFSAWMLKHPNLYRIQEQLNLFPKKGQALLNECIMVEDTISQEDRLSSIQNLSVANFQKVTGHLPLYGMAQPVSQAVSKVLDHLTNVKMHSHVIFINLRNDVSVEIHGKLYYVSNTNDPNKQPIYFNELSNYNDIESLFNVESFRKQLKFHKDVNNSETPDLIEMMTTKDVFRMTEGSFPNQLYYHVPIPLNYLSNENIFDSLLEVFINVERKYKDNSNLRKSIEVSHRSSTGAVFSKSHSNKNTCRTSNNSSVSSILFNPAYCFFCPSGIERTTFAMAVACLYMYQKVGFPPGTLPGEQERISLHDAEQSMGNFPIVRRLVALLPDGYQIKREVDFVLDNLFEMMSTTHFHMREMILATYNLARKTSEAETKKNFYCQSILLLERYIYLILFNSYLNLEKNPLQKSFCQWMNADAQTVGVHDVLDNLHISETEFGHIKINTLRDRWRYLNEHKTGDIL